ncbi:TPA: M20 family metallopeptidase [Candidatus Bathyarchaeota archaeon]|nr:M20 family metallopeptidase [Candidatus Bathyarchaeota archaeon]
MVDVKVLKESAKKEVESQRKRLVEIAKWMYENPELSSEEFKAYALLTEELEKQGAKVDRKLFGMPTAFSASWKGKKKGPKVAVLAEYDALPGVGHGCGHNLIAASAIGSGVAAARAAKDFPGEILVVGTPAEEGRGPSAGSKVIMANKGFWDDVDAAIMLHPATHYGVGGKALGIWQLKMEFKGQTSHAAASPEKGINALNAATLAYMATHMLRQEARRDANLVIHGIITEGGLANNIIPDRTVCQFGVRSSNEKYLETMVDKVARCAEGAAISTGAQVTVTKAKLYSSMKPNIPLVKVLYQNYVDQGVKVDDWQETQAGIPMASTDFGDVSQRCPSTGSYIGIGPENIPGHSKQLADCTMTKAGLEAMIVGTKALAMTLVELLAKPEVLKEAKEYFKTY